MKKVGEVLIKTNDQEQLTGGDVRFVWLKIVKLKLYTLKILCL